MSQIKKGTGEVKIKKTKKLWVIVWEFLMDYWGAIFIGLFITAWIYRGFLGPAHLYTTQDKELAVIISVTNHENGIYKIKYLRDGVVQVVNLEYNSYIKGDTTLVKR